MSLILDALRKSDRQRVRHMAERLRDGPPVASAPGFSGLHLALLTLTIAVTAMAIAIALLLRQPGPQDRTGQVTQIMENEPAGASARVRSLGAELARTARSEGELVVQQPAATASALPVEALSAPPIGTLPPAVRARLPELHLDIHAWAEDPGARFVLINLHRYAEGERLAEGPRVLHIAVDGVVLEHDGIMFSLPRN